MGRNKGDYDLRLRGDKELRPTNWLDKKSLAFLPKGESGNLKRMNDYLCLHKAQTEWYRSTNEKIALLATISRNRQCHMRVLRQAEPKNCNVRCYEWAPVKGGESLRQNIPLRTFQDLIRNDDPSAFYRLYIVSENDIVFYVGKAFNPVDRLCGRLNPYNGRNDDTFAKFLRRYIDDALATWRVQLLTLQDCEPFVAESFLLPEFDAETIRSEVMEKYTTDTDWAMGQAERFLIWLYQPCLNDQHTPFPTPLPAKYSNWDEILVGKQTSRLRRQRKHRSDHDSSAMGVSGI